MNFTELWNQYWDLSLELPISVNDSALYMYLLRSFQKFNKNPIGHSDRHLSDMVGVSVNTIRTSKKRLESFGLIKIEIPANKSRSTEGQTRYFLCPTVLKTVSTTDTVFDTVHQTVSKTVLTSDTVNDTVSTKNTETVSRTVSPSDTNTILIDNTILSNNTVLSNIPNTNVFGQEKKSENPKKEKGKEEKKPSAQKKEESTPHWQTLVDTWFLFYEGKFNHKPSFSGSDPRDFKNILSRLQTRAAMKGMEWTEQHAAATLNMFLDVAVEDKWLNSNFLLSNLSRQFDKIVTYANSKANGETGRGTFQSALQKLNLLYPDD